MVEVVSKGDVIKFTYTNKAGFVKIMSAVIRNFLLVDSEQMSVKVMDLDDGEEHVFRLNEIYVFSVFND